LAIYIKFYILGRGQERGKGRKGKVERKRKGRRGNGKTDVSRQEGIAGEESGRKRIGK